MDTISIGKRLKDLRLSRKLSQDEVAKFLKVGRTTYVKYENGSINPSKKLQELAQFFHVSTDYLLGRDESTPESEERPHVKKIDSLPQDTAPINDLVSELFADRPDVCALLKNGVYANKNGTLVKTDLSDLPPSAKENLRNNILFVLESTGYLPKK